MIRWLFRKWFCWRDKYPPFPPTHLTWRVKKMAKQARVLLMWQKSISTDVVSQQMLVEVVGVGPLVNVNLPASVEELVVEIPEKSMVHVELRASDGTNLSEPAVLDFQIDDLTQPAAPTGLMFEILEITNEPGEEVPPLG